MLDVKLIRENPDKVRKGIKDKGFNIDIDHILEIDSKKRELDVKVQSLREERNKAAKAQDIDVGKRVKEELQRLEPQLEELERKFNEEFNKIPNLPLPQVPIGVSEKDNVEK